MRRLCLCLIVALTPIAGLAQAPARQPPQEPVATFRAGVRAIPIDVVVTDQDGNPVRGLTVEDFEITERGRPQPITTFEAVDIPIERQLPDLADADVVTNEGDGRIYLIVIDAISPTYGMYAKRELRKFFDQHFGPNDSAAIMFLDKAHSNAGQDFTSNRRLLIKGIDSIVGSPDGRAAAGSASLFPQFDPLGAAAILARNRMSRLKDLTEFLIKIPGRRKAMMLVTEAIGFDATDFKDYAGTTLTPAANDAHAAMTAATRGNIAIYPINPGGVMGDNDLTGESLPSIEAQQALAGANLAPTMELRSLAAATGGFAVVNSNSFDAAFTRLVRENSIYYMLGFNSAEDRDDGRFVPVQVRMKQPGLKVLARDGYIAPFKGRDNVTSPERQPGVGAALASPIPVGGVTLRAFAAPFRGRGKTAAIAVALEMDPQALGLVEQQDGGWRGSIDVRLVPIDVRSKVLPQIRQLGNISVPADARAGVERAGLRVLTKTDLQPGRYQLRIAVGTAQRGGSVIYDLDVPDFSKKQLAMSGVALRGANDPEGIFLPAGDPLQALAIRAPTTVRLFRDGDRVSVFAEVYDSTGGRPHTVDVRAALHSEAGEVTTISSVSRSSDELKKNGDVLRFEAPLPLTKLPAGRYVVSIEASSSAGGDTVSRSVPFRVR
jgi:VWFA-related protein